MNAHEIEFSARVDVHDFGRMAYQVVYAPKKIITQLGLKDRPRLRVSGMVAGLPFHGAFLPARGGRYYLILSKKFCKTASIAPGDGIQVELDIADQNAVDVPRQLEFALNSNSRARRIWDSISSGKKRGFAYRVASAKRVATIENRVEEVIDALLALEDR